MKSKKNLKTGDLIKVKEGNIIYGYSEPFFAIVLENNNLTNFLTLFKIKNNKIYSRVYWKII